MTKAVIPTKRRSYIDALKGLGILLVLFGHFEEYYRGSLSGGPFFNATFECIYMFHMALFCICSGLVAKFSFKKLFAQQVWLYFLGQAIMYVFRIIVMREDLSASGGPLMALIVPWRHMWYLYALMFWQLTVPLLTALRDRLGWTGSLLGMAAATAVGLWAGTVDWPYALGRVFSFFPFFAFGLLFRDAIDVWFRLGSRHWVVRWLPALTALLIYGFWFVSILKAPEQVYEGARIWQSDPYSENYTALSRAVFYLVGILTTLALVNSVGRCHGLEGLGQRTLPVYLFHMPVMAFLIELGTFGPAGEKGFPALLGWILFLTGGTTCLLASAPIHTIFNAVANLWYKTLPQLFRGSK